MKKLVLLSFLLLFFATINFAQDKTIDSLKLALKNAKHDTMRSNILAELAEIADDGEWEKYNELLKILTEAKLKITNPSSAEYKLYQKLLATSLHNTGFIYKNQGDISKALEYYGKSQKIQEEIDDKEGIAITYHNIGAIYNKQGHISKALEYYGKSLKIKEEINDKEGIASSLNAIGIVYKNQGDDDKALEYYGKSLKISKEIGDKKEMSQSLNNIGVIYSTKGDMDKALNYYTKSLKIDEEIGNKKGLSVSLSNIGMIYKKRGEMSKALEYYGKSLEISKEIGDEKEIAHSLNYIGNVFFTQKNYIKSLEYATKSMALSQELGFPENIRGAAILLNKTYSAMGNYKLALQNYELYITMRDSITNQENKKASIKSQFKYEYEKKSTADSVKVAEEKKVVAIQFKQEKTQRFALYGGLVLVLLFAGFMFNRFRVTQKQKNIIEIKEKETQYQKYIIEEKHKEITDSINYAERIQRSFLATKELLDDNLSSLRGGTASSELASGTKQSQTMGEIATLPLVARNDESNYFVFFKPKDVVSGDFYWASTLSNNNFALVTADSTGHGVPGAIMSLLNVTSLEKAIEHHTNPDDILNHTRQTIIERLKKDGSEEGGKDGMDCSLLVFDFANKQLHIAAANNPVWIIRGCHTERSRSVIEGNGNKSNEQGFDSAQPDKKYEFIEIKPDKMAVGRGERQQESFTLHTIELQKGDTVYTLTDGFPDQFGGPNGKKFMSKKLKELLLANVHLPIPQQQELLKTTFKNWVGDLEQVDDVCVVGIRI